MKLYKITLLVMFLGLKSIAQNWTVFNTGFRYNYKYANSTLVSQVIFADSVKLVGADSVFYLNRIGLECKGSCPTITSSIGTTATVIVPNMPQFLQRTIRKLSNGTVVLKDTATLVLNPNAQVGQSWLFDSINNVLATCVGKVQQTNLGVSDSVKYLLIGSMDTLTLSKRFGILQFPQLYSQGKKYRLVGVENASRFDSTALFGEKVPNAWDIYNFDIGDAFCYASYSYYKNANGTFLCNQGNYAISGKTVTPTGYTYAITDNRIDCSSGASNTVSINTAYVAYAASSPTLLANYMYPGKIINSSHWINCTSCNNLTKFGVDNKGRFYKYAGNGLSTNPVNGITFPFNNTNTYPSIVPGVYYLPTNFLTVTEVFGNGIGHIDFTFVSGASDHHYKRVTCAVKNGSIYYGNADFVGLPVNGSEAHSIAVFPNPTQGLIKVRTENIHNKEIKITNLIGEDIETEITTLSDALIEINMSVSDPGVYYLSVLENSKLIRTYKIIKE